MVDNRVDQWRQVAVGRWHTNACHGQAVASNSREHWKRQVMIRMSQIQKQLLDFMQHFFWTSILTIHLVDYQNHWQVESQGLRQHITGLWQRAFCGVDEKQNSIDHRQRTLYFPTKVGVARSVNQVDLGALPFDLCGFRQNSDASFTFLIVVIHNAIDDCRVSSKGSCRTQESV